MTETVLGLKKLQKRLRKMEPKLRKKLTRKAIRKAGKVVHEAAKERVPKESGDLKKSIKLRALKRSRKNKHRVGVRVISGGRFFQGEYYYGGHVEYGTSDTAAEPYMRPARDNHKDQVLLVFRTEASKLIREL